MKRLLAVLVGLALALVGTMAVAAWLSTGSGGASVIAGSLAAPTDVAGSHEDGTGDVDVSWTASAGTPVPTGYYVFREPSDGPAEPACGSSLSSPVTTVSCTDSGVPLGSFTYTVVALFHNWTRASSPSADVVVARASQTVTITSSPASPTYGGTYPLTASGGGSGNAIVFGTATPGVCTVSGSTASFVHAGTCTLTADQAGSTYYDAAPQATQQFVVAKANQTVSYTSNAPSGAVVGGTGYTPTATGGASGNPVTFSIDGTSSGVCSISSGVVSFQHVGTCVVDADQAGNGDYLPANRVQQSIAVGQGSQGVNFTSTAPGDAKVNGATYSVAATGGGSGNVVTFSSATPSVCTVSGTTVSFPGAGTCTINANQAGNADYLPATQVQQSFSVAKGDQMITFTSTAPGSRAAGTTYTPAATASSGLSVSFTVSGACSISSGTVTFGPAAGTCTISANQAGNTSYNAAPQVQQTVTVTAAGPAITACTRNVSNGQITVTWSPFSGATSYKLNLSSGTSATVSPVTSPFTTTTLSKNLDGTVSVVAVTASGDRPGPSWTYDGSGSNQTCHS